MELYEGQLPLWPIDEGDVLGEWLRETLKLFNTIIDEALSPESDNDKLSDALWPLDRFDSNEFDLFVAYFASKILFDHAHDLADFISENDNSHLIIYLLDTALKESLVYNSVAFNRESVLKILEDLSSLK